MRFPFMAVKYSVRAQRVSWQDTNASKLELDRTQHRKWCLSRDFVDVISFFFVFFFVGIFNPLSSSLSSARHNSIFCFSPLHYCFISSFSSHLSSSSPDLKQGWPPRGPITLPWWWAPLTLLSSISLIFLRRLASLYRTRRRTAGPSLLLAACRTLLHRSPSPPSSPEPTGWQWSHKMEAQVMSTPITLVIQKMPRRILHLPRALLTAIVVVSVSTPLVIQIVMMVWIYQLDFFFCHFR